VYETIEGMRRFLETGGPVLWLIGLTAVLLGTLIIECYWRFRRDFPKQMSRDIAQWHQRDDRSSWYALRIRESLIAGAGVRLKRTLPLINILVALCPMLGLLGTVTGMMAVFDIIAVLGTGNVRGMAAGISQATIPTMAGMMVALPGIYFRVALQREVSRRIEQFADRLSIQ
jgi:biopolymer transport protein ExbB